MELAWSMDTIGPMGRSVEDCGYVLQAIAGYDAQDFSTSAHPFQFRPSVRRKEFRLGVLPLDYASAPETEKVFASGLGALRKVGMKVAPAKLPDYPYADIVMSVLHGEAVGAHEGLIRSEKLHELADEGQKEALRKYLTMSAAELTRAQQLRTRAARGVLDLFETFDALVAPTLVGEAVTSDADLSARPRARLSYMALGALAGVPCLSVPMGFGHHGLPLGLLIIGNRFAENTVLHIGTLFQRETDWHLRHPAHAAGV
jgi:Asp-tRNA(Asn)/Glu-tRNA(Gln) amidotransferase A subunit family amidase